MATLNKRRCISVSSDCECSALSICRGHCTTKYSTMSMSRGHFSPKSSRKWIRYGGCDSCFVLFLFCFFLSMVENLTEILPLWLLCWEPWRVILDCDMSRVYDTDRRRPTQSELYPFLLTCALRRSIVLQFFWHVDTRPILPFLFFFNSTFYLCIIIVTFYLMYLIH